MKNDTIPLSARYSAVDAPESAWLRVCVTLAQRKRLIVLGTLAAAVVTAILVLLMPVTYTATTTILTPQTGSGAAALLGQLGALGSMGALTSLGSEAGELKSPADTFLGVLGSRTVADDLIQRFELETVYKKRTLVDTRKSLAKHTHVELTRGWLIQISVEDHDVQRAVAMTNGYVDELYKVNRQLALTSGAQRRLFLEQQLNDERKSLEKAEADFQEIQQKTGVVQLAGQAEITLRSIAQLRATIAAKEVEIAMLRRTATEENPGVQALEGEIAALRVQMSKAESSSPQGEDSYFVSAGRIPTAGLEYLRRTRELRYHEALFEMLARQYESARIDEAKAPPVIQVVDKAIAPDKRSWPPRTLLVMLAGFVAFFALSGVVLLESRFHVMAMQPANAAHLITLKQMIPWRLQRFSARMRTASRERQ